MYVEVIKEYFPTFEDALVDEISQNGILKTIEADDYLMDIGQKIEKVPLIIEGQVKIFREDEQGRELFLHYLQPGDACAISMVCSQREKISKIKAVTLEKTKAIIVDIDFMDAWMKRYQSWYYFVVDTYSDRFEEVLKTLDSIAFQKMDQRLVNYLLKNAEAQNSMTLKTTHQQIANDLSTSREVISRLLKKLEQNGHVKLHRNMLEIVDL